MRCNNCLQIIEFKDIGIVISEHPQGSLNINCPKCGWNEAYNISMIPKQKAPFCKIKSVYEGD